MTDIKMQGADYYRGRAAEMLEKAQEAPSKGMRAAYLNLARRWNAEALRLSALDREKPRRGKPKKNMH